MIVDCVGNTVAITDINGKGYDAAATYSFTVPSFNAAGGDGYPLLSPVMTGYDLVMSMQKPFIPS